MVIFNPAGEYAVCKLDQAWSLTIIETIERDCSNPSVACITFSNGDFRYFHNNRLEPIPTVSIRLIRGQDDLNAIKILVALANVDGNIFLQLAEGKSQRSSSPSQFAGVLQAVFWQI